MCLLLCSRLCSWRVRQKLIRSYTVASLASALFVSPTFELSRMANAQLTKLLSRVAIAQEAKLSMFVAYVLHSLYTHMDQRESLSYSAPILGLPTTACSVLNLFCF